MFMPTPPAPLGFAVFLALEVLPVIVAPWMASCPPSTQMPPAHGVTPGVPVAARLSLIVAFSSVTLARCDMKMPPAQRWTVPS